MLLNVTATGQYYCAHQPSLFLCLRPVSATVAMHWGAVPRQLITWMGMYFVVAFSSCLDVAAIEMDVGKSLDVHHELGNVVGISNVVSGLFGAPLVHLHVRLVCVSVLCAYACTSGAMCLQPCMRVCAQPGPASVSNRRPAAEGHRTVGPIFSSSSEVGTGLVRKVRKSLCGSDSSLHSSESSFARPCFARR